jgi:phosphoribosyl 1,2-cyclic phosphodiesterase
MRRPRVNHRAACRPAACVTTELREALIVKLCVLASGSSGNCTFIATGSTRILVDAGLSRREIASRLEAIGERPEALDAILVSHEHSDHVSGLPVLVRAVKAPVYLSELTAPAIEWGEAEPSIVTFQAGSRFTIGDIEVRSFTLPHDAADPVGFTFSACGVKIGVVTDLGYIPESVKHHLKGTDLLVLESNHDLEMLKVGPYPWSVKQRVMSRKGHLSNDLVCEFIGADLDRSVSLLVLGHLSENNNHPELVRIGAMQALQRRALSPRLVVAAPRRQTEVFTL